MSSPARPDRARGLRLALILLGLAAPSARAQVVDSLPADSIPADTVDRTALFLEAQEAERVVLPVLPRIGVEGPRAPLSRIVISRDSIDWAMAQTVGDLLQRVPGVYLWRGGWFGRPEYPDYQGRGASSVEYVVDGLPFVPLGTDTLAVDPSLFALALIERIEVERWPGFLRVHLFTRRNDRRAARSWVGVASGDRSITRYSGGLERRFGHGLGLALAGDYFDAPTGSGFSSGSTVTNYWIQGSWVPSARFGVQVQSLRQRPERKAFERAAGDTIGLPLDGTRTDNQLRVSWRAAPSAPRLDLLAGRSHWDGDGVEQAITQVGAVADWRTPRFHVGGSAFHRSRWTPWDVRGRAGLVGVAGFTISGEVAWQRHDGDRTSQWVGARAGFNLPLGVVLSGNARIGKVVTQPSLASDTAQTLRDLQALVAWETGPIGLEAGFTRTHAFQARPYAPFLLVDSLRPAGDVDWLTLRARITPLSWITLEGWYSDPLTGSVDGIPPTHSVTTATIRSRFLRSFPSGIFDVKLQLGMEAWGTGTIGTAGGNPIVLGGATYFRGLIEIQLGSLSLYYDRLNMSGAKRAYVPEYALPRFGSVFGARWEFRN